jgi:hypothetical protein
MGCYTKLYYKFVGIDLFILVLYVDDLFLIGEKKLIVGCKENMKIDFEMKNIGMMHYFLGLGFGRTCGEIFLGQCKYAVEILKRYHMDE